MSKLTRNERAFWLIVLTILFGGAILLPPTPKKSEPVIEVCPEPPALPDTDEPEYMFDDDENLMPVPAKAIEPQPSYTPQPSGRRGFFRRGGRR